MLTNNPAGKSALKKPEHHVQYELCRTRPAYRQGRKLTAVKVYTVNSESQHLFVYGVPKINLRNELRSLCTKYGRVTNIHTVIDHETEMFTECYHVRYERIQSARIAKRLLDNKSFYGGILHVCYSPEYESQEETKAKLLQRTKDVLNRAGNSGLQLPTAASQTDSKIEEFVGTTKSQLKKKRKQGDMYVKSDIVKGNVYHPKVSATKRFKSAPAAASYGMRTQTGS